MNQFQDKLRSTPFFRLLVPFIAGIILGEHISPELKWIFLGLSIVMSLLLFCSIPVTFKREYLYGIILFPAVFFLGMFFSTDLRYIPEPLPNREYFAVIDEYPLEKEKSFRAVIRLTKPKIRVLAYFEKNASIASAEPGSLVWFRGEPELIQKSGNPFEFDYQAYAVRNKIGHRIYLKVSDFHFLQEGKIPDLAEWSLIIRDRMLKIIEKSGLKGEVFHLVSAVSLGAREELEPETTQSFSKTGVTHVLAVSGMNVAIIFVVLDWMLQFLKRKRGGIIIQTIIILVGVWGYALITGLSASVLRAAAMFSFIVIGKSMSRNSNIYNTLAASAFVLLCFNPSLIWDVGFQLSYAAVFSIVFFHPFLYGLCYFKYWIPDQIWTLITVSVAAQIGTLPFLLHYFHQFPTWFLLANLMVIPLVTVILYLSFVVFAVAPIVPFLGILFTRILDGAGQGMLFSVRFVEKLPYSVIEGIYPTDLLLVVVVLFSVLVSVFIAYRNRTALAGSLIMVVIILIINIINSTGFLLQKEVVVFNLPEKTLLALTSGKKTVWLTSDSAGNTDKLKYYTKPYEGFRGITTTSVISMADSSLLVPNSIVYRRNFLNFKGIALYILNEGGTKNNNWEHFPQTDIVILSGKSDPDLTRILTVFPKAVIIDSRTPVRFNTINSSPLIGSGRFNILNTNQKGAVQIRFNVNKAGAVQILTCGYFGPG